MSVKADTDKLLEVLGKHLGGLIGGFGSLISGILAFLDDIHDFPKFDHIHHWFLGLLGIIGGLTSLAITFKQILDELGIIGETYELHTR
ncbi:hypothetical protein DRP04_09955 [Archaeoglobales archaeon]|nr:MAG: hypothetical protein DRP04_09955 [Archaeoglobales archaeon]